MFLFPDDSVNNGSDAEYDPVSQADRDFFSDNQNSQGSSGGAQNKSRRDTLLEEAKKIMRRGAQKAPSRLATRLGAPKDVSKALRGDTPENREKVKDYAKEKARKFAQEQISKKIANKGIKTGFKKGLNKSVKGAAKEGVKRAGKQAAKIATKGAAKAGAKVAVEAGAVAAEEAAVGAVAASGAATFGIGFVLALLLQIAISLGINDAVEAAFELKDGNFRHAKFLAIRAAMKVGMFVYFLVAIVSVFSIGGIFIAMPLLFILNVYMVLGFAFPKIAQFQGLVWWEMVVIVMVDVMAFIIFLAFITALGWYLCGEGSIPGFVMNAIGAVYDWWNKSTAGSVASDFCKYVNNAASVPAQ